MFGFGPLEIALVAALLVLLLGAPRAGRLLGRAFKTWRKVEEVRGQLRTPFSLKSFVFGKFLELRVVLPIRSLTLLEKSPRPFRRGLFSCCPDVYRNFFTA